MEERRKGIQLAESVWHSASLALSESRCANVKITGTGVWIPVTFVWLQDNHENNPNRCPC